MRRSSVRISLASPEADLAAVVWPGVESIYYPRVESADQIQTADAIISRLEKLRGLRPGTVEVTPMIESPRGVALAHELASASSRITAFGVGPNISLGLGVEPGWDADSLTYARSECELAARALDLAPTVIELVLD
jgi:citrate lyase subunit beta/citryl-CoA lyase